MRIILRVLAAIVWVATALMAFIIWYLWRLGHLALATTGFPGMIRMLEWALTLVLGPVAAMQLWRLQESGRRISLFLSVFAITDLVVSWLFFPRPGAIASGVLTGVAGNAIFSALLLSPQARRACSGSDVKFQS